MIRRAIGPRVESAERPDVGDTVDDFTLVDSAGVGHRLAELASRRRAVLLFYRGEW
jgi:peroxiredoxin